MPRKKLPEAYSAGKTAKPFTRFLIILISLYGHRFPGTINLFLIFLEKIFFPCNISFLPAVYRVESKKQDSKDLFTQFL